VRTYAQQVPVLVAQEQLRAVQAASLGSGNVKKSKAQSALRKLERAARKGEPREPASPRTLAAVGVQVKPMPEGGGDQ